MSEPTSLWERAKRARVIQVLAVYLGASWVVLQIADTLSSALTLPGWVMPVAVILLLVGLVVILSTAWVQSLPTTTAREQAGELPTDWQIAPLDAIASMRRGRIPHLTWGRSVAAGAVAISLLIGGAGMYVGFTGRPLPMGPSQASATEADEGIAVVPFDVRGPAELDMWREGMMDLLTNGLDGVGGFRTIDARTVMARWNELAGEQGTTDLDATLRVARATGALYALEGSVVGLGENVRLVANVYDLETGAEVATGQAEGPAADVLRLVDELAVQTMRSLLGSAGRAGSGDISAETMTTTSLPALRAFLQGESHYRRGDFAEAIQSYERAVAADTTFAIALVRLSEAYGWLESAGSDRMIEVGERAVAQAHRLSPRYQFIMEGWDALNHGTADGLASLREAVRKYPDDPEAWFLLAETYIHVPGPTYRSQEDIKEALDHATGLDPSFAPYLVHVAENAVIRGDRAAAEAALARYERLAGNRDALGHIEFAIPLLLGSQEEVDAALASAPNRAERSLDLYLGTFGRSHDHFAREAAVDAVLGRLTERNRDHFQAYYAGSMGQVERGGEIATRPSVNAVNRAVYWAHANELWNVTPPAGEMDPAACDTPVFSDFCHVFVGVANARLGRWSAHAVSLRRLREEVAAAPDSARAGHLEVDLAVVEGSGVWRRGGIDAGRRILQAPAHLAGTSGERARLELAWLEVAAGRPDQASRYFRSALEGFARPVALYGTASMHEQMGQPALARPYWDSLLTLTEDADDLARLTEAREALARGAGEAVGR
ncbi:MAG: hypothetical protein WEA24_12685 [Gemmatimonadota bacterium]